MSNEFKSQWAVTDLVWQCVVTKLALVNSTVGLQNILLYKSIQYIDLINWKISLFILSPVVTLMIINEIMSDRNHKIYV